MRRFHGAGASPGRCHRRAALGLAGLAIALTLSACASTPEAQAPSRTTTTSTSTTTSTTLPVPAGLPGTSPSGAFAALGPVERVPVVPLPAGAAVPPPAASGQAAPATVRIAFRSFGSGPDLLMIMGQHGTMTWWDPQLLETLAGSYTVTIFDFPGVGYSAPGTGPETVESYADATAGLIAALGLTKPVVLGWGLGGAVALSLAERHAALASRLVLVDATAGGPRAPRPTAAVSAALASPTATTTGLASLLFPPGAGAARIGWLARIGELSPDDIVASSVRTEAAVMTRLAGDPSVKGGLRALRLPVLVVSASEDEVTPPSEAAVLREEIPRAQSLTVSGAGYGVLVQDQSRVLAALAAFTASAAR